MLYNDFRGKKLPALGMGTMRLPQTEGEPSRIDYEKTAEMFDYAIKNGVNYFDTAWVYHDGMSEIAVGDILSKYPRDSYYIATKFPGFDLSNIEKVEEIFEKQLEKCKTEYFDFYLFHNVCEMNINEYLDESYGIHKYLMEQKKNGRIKHLGFSAHGSYDVVKRFLDAYGKDMEFCQLQINYLDWKFQSAEKKVQLVSEYNIPIWVMEPVRGGKLAALDTEHEAALKALRPEESIAAWAFRFLQTIPNMTLTLSGMSNFEQMKENIELYSDVKPLNEKEMSVLMSIADRIIEKSALPCTACKYCTSHCPKELDIPGLLELYNEHRSTEEGFIAPMALSVVPDGKKPHDCIGCRCCEAVCPQGIKISEAMSDFVSIIRG